MAPDSTSYPVLATVDKFGISSEHHGLLYEWAHHMKERISGEDTSPICTDPEDPFAKRLIAAFDDGEGLLFSIRDYLLDLQVQSAKTWGWFKSNPYVIDSFQCSR